MQEKVYLHTFPANECDALAMLYIQNQDLSGITPEQLYEKYQEARETICKHKKLCNDRKLGLIK